MMASRLLLFPLRLPLRRWHPFLMRRERNIGSDVLYPTVHKPEYDLNALERGATVRIFEEARKGLALSPPAPCNICS